MALGVLHFVVLLGVAAGTVDFLGLDVVAARLVNHAVSNHPNVLVDVLGDDVALSLVDLGNLAGEVFQSALEGLVPAVAVEVNHTVALLNLYECHVHFLLCPVSGSSL